MQNLIWTRFYFFISSLIFIGLFWALFIGSEGKKLNSELRIEQADLELSLNDRMMQNKELEDQIREMQNSHIYVEAFARSKLGLIKQNEEFIPSKELQSNEPK